MKPTESAEKLPCADYLCYKARGSCEYLKILGDPKVKTQYSICQWVVERGGAICFGLVLCALLALPATDSLAGPVCGDGILNGAAGNCNCCVGGNGLGCDCPECSDLICGLDPFCCNTTWDTLCDGAAASLCTCCRDGC